MKTDFVLTTPVLYLAFNRLNTVQKTFEEIKKVKPKQLFIACDGPRTKEEKKKTDAVRKYILENIDWKCKVKTLFRDKNLGCKYAVASAIDWFFENVEQGIILEDDCLPSQSFFRFCQEMLKRHNGHEKIMHISGTNIEEKSKIREDYFFSETFNVWGWATWRRAWDKYDVEMKEWGKINKKKFVNSLGYNLLGKIKSWRIYELTYRNKIDTWDYQWGFVCSVNSGLSVIPKQNLITNIGFGSGTHTTDEYTKRMKLKNYELSFPLKENKEIVAPKAYLLKYIKFFGGSITMKMIGKIKKLQPIIRGIFRKYL